MFCTYDYNRLVLRQLDIEAEHDAMRDAYEEQKTNWIQEHIIELRDENKDNSEYTLEDAQAEAKYDFSEKEAQEKLEAEADTYFDDREADYYG